MVTFSFVTSVIGKRYAELMYNGKPRTTLNKDFTIDANASWKPFKKEKKPSIIKVKTFVKKDNDTKKRLDYLFV